MAKSKKDARRKLLIEPEFQASFLGYTLGISAVVSSIFYAAIRYFFYKLELKGQMIGLPPEHVFFRFVEDEKKFMGLVFVVSAACISCALLFFGLYLSNRVAGPIYRLEKHLEAYLRDGQVEQLRFRKMDYFRHIAKNVNAITGKKISAPSTTTTVKKAS